MVENFSFADAASSEIFILSGKCGMMQMQMTRNSQDADKSFCSRAECVGACCTNYHRPMDIITALKSKFIQFPFKDSTNEISA